MATKMAAARFLDQNGGYFRPMKIALDEVVGTQFGPLDNWILDGLYCG